MKKSTRLNILFAIIILLAAGVLGTTGVESGELVRAVTERIHPACVIAVDALASRSLKRVCTAVQLADTGIVPGSGVGNHRAALNRETLGVPVIAIGVPTVVDGATLAAVDASAANPPLFALMLLGQCAIAPALNLVTTFGEEWGWRGYLMPKMATRLSIVPTMLVTGIIWGLWHAPVVALGHNYGTGYPGEPFDGIAAMCAWCTVLAIFLSYVTIRTGSTFAAAIGHGAVNGTTNGVTLFSLSGGNPFVGPLCTGIVGGLPLLGVAVVMLWDMRRREKAGTLRMPEAGLPDGVRHTRR